ncbi:hypothetical protein BGZ83_000749, partial [Gryganskiella cystojenkinii]
SQLPPPGSQPRRQTAATVSTTVVLDPEMMEAFEYAPPPILSSHRSTYLLPPSSSSPTSPSLTLSPSPAVATLRDQTASPLQPVVRGCTFVLFRVLLFPKTVFVRSMIMGRNILNRAGLARAHRSGVSQRPHRHYHHYHHLPHQHGGRQRHHYRSYQQSAANNSAEGSSDTLPPYRTQPHQQQQRQQQHGQRRTGSGSRSRSRSTGNDYPRSSTGPSRSTRGGGGNGGEGPLSVGARSNNHKKCWPWFRNNYNVQVAMICLCLTGESFAQSVMCPFLYYMVRDFHVGPDIWIGYYADKYGRKTILLFGLFMTSLSTLCLGLSTCYHDAMWALVVQGACTGLVPVSKCSIGELANRQQRVHDTEQSLAQAQLEGRLFIDKDDDEDLHEKPLAADGEDDIHGEGVLCTDPDCTEVNDRVESRLDRNSAVPVVKAREDFASKGYSALVIALALGAALGPLAGGSLTKRHIHGFGTYPYFAPCLLAACMGIFITGIVALMLNETHPKWSRPTEYEKLLEVRTRAANMYLQEPGTSLITSRGRPGYEQSGRYRETVIGSSSSPAERAEFTDKDEGITEIREDSAPLPLNNETRSRLRSQGGVASAPTTVCTCPVTPSSSSYSTSSSKPNLLLSPATELYLILAIYTLLVLCSIMGSEFVMLYTQSPVSRGGLEFSAKVLGQVLTMRGILKLTFNLFGYPWMVKRVGLLNCLRLGIVVIGSVSVMGLGWFVPWSVENENVAHHADVENHGSAISRNSSERPPVGMTAILLCLSVISIGDVLGYISVLVLFGKSADRLKGGSKKVNTEGPSSCQPQQHQGGSGVLWSVAQVSANVMRLTGPVLAGLLWSLTDKSSTVAVSDIRRVGPNVGNGGSRSDGGSSQSTFSALSPSDLSDGSGDDHDDFQESHGSFWSLASKILRGSTSVFYLVGAICVVNMIASQLLYLASPASSKSALANRSISQLHQGRQQQQQQQQEQQDTPQPEEYFMQPGYSSGL